MHGRPEPPKRGPMTDEEFAELKRRSEIRFAWREGFLTGAALFAFLGAFALWIVLR
jgi:hypothetical protein